MAYLNETGLQRLLVRLRDKLVPKTTKINGKALTQDITLEYADIGPLPPASIPVPTTSVRGGIMTTNVGFTIAPSIWVDRGSGKWQADVYLAGQGITAFFEPTVDLNTPSYATKETVDNQEIEWAKVFRVETADDYIKFYAVGDTAPSVNLDVFVRLVKYSG